MAREGVKTFASESSIGCYNLEFLVRSCLWVKCLHQVSQFGKEAGRQRHDLLSDLLNTADTSVW